MHISFIYHQFKATSDFVENKNKYADDKIWVPT